MIEETDNENQTKKLAKKNTEKYTRARLERNKKYRRKRQERINRQNFMIQLLKR
jgi:hypothetical protein